MTRVRLSDIMAPHFYDLHRDIKEHGHTYYWLEGGRGSTKSSDISIEIPQLLIKNPKCHAVVLRKVAATIKTSVYAQMQWGIDALGLGGKFKYHKTPYEIIRKSTGQKILFFGVDEPEKLKSIKLEFGYVGIVWFEELDQFAGMAEIRNINQSLLRGGPKFWEFCSFNPPKSQNNWVNEEKLVDAPDRLVHHSTYLGVPREWLGDHFIELAEKTKKRDIMAYRHEYLGEVTGTGGAVFENVEDMRMSDELVKSFDRRYFGLDFGFAVDPLAFTCMHYDRKHRELYIFGEIYGQKMTNRMAADRIKPLLGSYYVTADSAEPKSITEMHTLGLRIEGARKGPDSVDYGIRWLQSLTKIHIDKRRAPNTYREFVCYEYERNREGQFISAYPDKDNHTIDSVRYGLERAMLGDTIVPRRVNY